MKITRLSIKNFRGIEALDTEISPTGMIVKGGNGRGKTSVLGAIRAALEARDISPDAIRIGHDRADILVDLDDVTVRRVIGQARSTVKVVDGKGAEVRSPQKYLNELIGGAGLDPVAFFEAKPKDRREMLFAAFPLRLTVEQLAMAMAISVPVPEGFEAPPTAMDTLARSGGQDRHALDVLGSVHEELYAYRTRVNAAHKHMEAAIEAKPIGLPPARPDSAPVLSLADAREGFDRSCADVAAVERRRAAHEAVVTANAGAKTQIETVTEQVAQLERDLAALEDPEPTLAELNVAMDSSNEEIGRLEQELQRAHDRRMELQVALHRMEKLAADRDAIATRRANLVEMVANMEKMIAPAEPVAAGDIELAVATRDRYTRAMEYALALQGHEQRMEERRKEMSKASALSALSGALTGALKEISERLPARLMAEQSGIPGLRVTGETIYVDDVNLDGLSGREQLMLSVEVARRANRSGLIIVDKLEAIDPDHLDEFVRAATKDGFQLLATRVERGDVVLEHLAPEDA